MGISEFETLLSHYLPKHQVVKDGDGMVLVCAKGKNPNQKKIRKLCMEKYHCKHLINKYRLKEGDVKFYKGES